MMKKKKNGKFYFTFTGRQIFLETDVETNKGIFSKVLRHSLKCRRLPTLYNARA